MKTRYRISHMLCTLLTIVLLCPTTTYAEDANLTERLDKLTPATDTALRLTGYERLTGGESADGLATSPDGLHWTKHRDGFNWNVLNQGKSVAPAGSDIQFKRVAEEGSTHHPSSAIRRGNDLLFWYTENAGQGKGYRIAAGKLAGQWPKGE